MTKTKYSKLDTDARIRELLKEFPDTAKEEWRRHKNGGGFVHKDSTASNSFTLGERVVVCRGSTIEGSGTIIGKSYIRSTYINSSNGTVVINNSNVLFSTIKGGGIVDSSLENVDIDSPYSHIARSILISVIASDAAGFENMTIVPVNPLALGRLMITGDSTWKNFSYKIP